MEQYTLVFTPEAEADLARLFEFLAAHDFHAAERALERIESALQALCHHPFICRKAAHGALGPLVRELVISAGSTGYVALFEIDSETRVTVMAVRHQLESDYH